MNDAHRWKVRPFGREEHSVALGHGPLDLTHISRLSLSMIYSKKSKYPKPRYPCSRNRSISISQGCLRPPFSLKNQRNINILVFFGCPDHRLGQGASQEHPRAVTGVPKSIPRSPQDHAKITPRPRQDHPKTTPRPPIEKVLIFH